MGLKEEQALRRSRLNKNPNSDFSNAWDLGILGKIKGMLGYGATCTNTATSFYYPNRTTAGSNNLLNNPEQAGFKIVNLKDAIPGSIIVISNPDGTERHSVIFDSVHKGAPYWYYDSNDRNLYYVQEGDTLVNYSNGKHEKGNYRKGVPLNKAFVGRTKHTYLLSKKKGGKFKGEYKSQSYLGFSGDMYLAAYGALKNLKLPYLTHNKIVNLSRWITAHKAMESGYGSALSNDFNYGGYGGKNPILFDNTNEYMTRYVTDALTNYPDIFKANTYKEYIKALFPEGHGYNPLDKNGNVVDDPKLYDRWKSFSTYWDLTRGTLNRVNNNVDEWINKGYNK